MSDILESPMADATTTSRGAMTPAQVVALLAAATTADIAAAIAAIPDANGAIRGFLGIGAQLLRGAKRGEVVSINSVTGSLAVNFATANNYAHTTTENTTLANPTNTVAGQHGAITITQGATARTLGFGVDWKFPGGTVPTLTATPGAIDLLTYYVVAPGFVVASLLKDCKR